MLGEQVHGCGQQPHSLFFDRFRRWFLVRAEPVGKSVQLFGQQSPAHFVHTAHGVRSHSLGSAVCAGAVCAGRATDSLT
jgi:hypothetical protein